MWLLVAALSALGIALAVLAFLVYGAMRGGREFARECLTYEGVDE